MQVYGSIIPGAEAVARLLPTTVALARAEPHLMLDPPDSLSQLPERLRAWETVYNTVRPHQALGQLTPNEFYQLWVTTQAERG
jgi:transposase InsO family protein